MMRSSRISRGLWLALVATAARAQPTVAAGAKAVVGADTVPVYATMSSSGELKATLKRGDRVSIGLVLFGDDTTWCAVTKAGETRRLGFASCEFLEQDRGGIPPPPAEPKKPITIREAPPPLQAPPAPPLAELAPPEPAAPPKPEPVKEPPPPEPAPAPPAVVREPDPAPAPPNPPDFVETALDSSGLRALLDRYTRTTNLMAFLDKGRLAEIDVAALDRVLTAQFEPGAFSRAVGDQIDKNYPPQSRQALVEWLRSPGTQKLAGLERRALDPSSHEALVAFASDLSKSRPAESRLELIHRIYDGLKICDVEVESTIALVHTTALAIGPALPREKRYTAGELDRALGTVKARYRSIMKNARLVHYLFAYQSASDQELEQYAGFLESESGKLFASLIGKGFYDATETISRALLIEIPRNLKRR